jgi:dihydropteroate synthase
VVAEVRDFLLQRVQAVLAAGVDRRRIILDPGIGFGKATEHNLALLRSVGVLVNTGYPILIGASRKRFIAGVGAGMDAVKTHTPHPTSDAGGRGVSDRLGGTCAVTAHCVAAGIQLLRVHDVAANRQAADLVMALKG